MLHGCALWGFCTTAKMLTFPHADSHSFQRVQEMSTKVKAHVANQALLYGLTYLESMLKGFIVNEGEREKIRLQHHTYHFNVQVSVFYISKL